MNRFHLIKTIQLVLVILLTIAALLYVFLNPDVYTAIAADTGTGILAVFLWVGLGISFVFLYYDFYSYAGMKRENTELDHAVYSDALTGIANRYSVDVFISRFLNKPVPKDMGCITLEIDNLGEINSRLGHQGGDAAIQAFSEILQHASSGICFIGRNGGNKFLAIIQECSEKRIQTFLSGVEEQVAEHNRENEDLPLKYSCGTAFAEGSDVHTITELIALSDRRAWKQMQERG